MRALVTGATGFIGRHLVKALLARGDEVCALVRSETRAEPLRRSGVRVLVADLGAPASLSGVTDGVEAVFHLASVVRGSAAEFERVDIEGTERLLGEAERSGVRRFVYTGTLSAYPLAASHHGAIIDEHCPLDGSGLLGNYARAKVRAEQLVLDAHRRGRLESVILRLGLTCGPGAEVLPAHVGRALGPRLLIVFGDGRIPLPLTYIDNAVDALILAATVEGVGGEVFNIVDDGELISQLEYLDLYRQASGPSPRVVKLPRLAYYALGTTAEWAAAIRGKEPGTTRYRVKSRLRRVRWDCSKAHRLLNWQPRVSLRAGLTQLFREHAVASHHGQLEGAG